MKGHRLPLNETALAPLPWHWASDPLTQELQGRESRKDRWFAGSRLRLTHLNPTRIR